MASSHYNPFDILRTIANMRELPIRQRPENLEILRAFSGSSPPPAQPSPTNTNLSQLGGFSPTPQLEEEAIPEDSGAIGELLSDPESTPPDNPRDAERREEMRQKKLRAEALRELLYSDPRKNADLEVSKFFAPEGSGFGRKLGAGLLEGGASFARAFADATRGTPSGIRTPSEIIREQAMAESARKTPLFQRELADLEQDEREFGRNDVAREKIGSSERISKARLDQQKILAGENRQFQWEKLNRNQALAESAQGTRERIAAINAAARIPMEIRLEMARAGINPDDIGEASAEQLDTLKTSLERNKIRSKAAEAMVRLLAMPKKQFSHEIVKYTESTLNPDTGMAGPPIEKTKILPRTSNTVPAESIEAVKRMAETGELPPSSGSPGGSFVPPPVIRPNKDPSPPTPQTKPGNLGAPKLFSVPASGPAATLPRTTKISSVYSPYYGNGFEVPSATLIQEGVQPDPNEAVILRSRGPGPLKVQVFLKGKSKEAYESSLKSLGRTSDTTSMILHGLETGKLRSGWGVQELSKLAGRVGSTGAQNALGGLVNLISGTKGKVDFTYLNQLNADLKDMFLQKVYDNTGKQINANEMRIMEEIVPGMSQNIENLVSRMFMARIMTGFNVLRQRMLAVLTPDQAVKLAGGDFARAAWSQADTLTKTALRGHAIRPEEFRAQAFMAEPLAKLARTDRELAQLVGKWLGME